MQDAHFNENIDLIEGGVVDLVSKLERHIQDLTVENQALKQKVELLDRERCDWDCDSCHEHCWDEQVSCGDGCHVKD